MTHFHTFFLGLTVLGYDTLWGTLIRTGTAKAIGVTKAAGILPDGNILRQTYTALPYIDRLLIAPVIFYDSLMREQNPTFRSLLASLFCTMQTTSFCMIGAGWIYGFPRWWTVVEPMFWGVLNQTHGAAFVYPLYLFVHVHYVAETPKRDNLDSLMPADAEALLYTALLAGVVPVWLLLPAFVPCSSETRQLLIASYRLTPIILGLAQPIVSTLIKTARRTPLARETIRPLVQTSLVLSGAMSVVGHWYALVYAVSSPSVTLASVFWPWATEVEGASVQSVIGLGCHLFLQNDFWVILVGFIPFASVTLCNLTGECKSGDGISSLSKAKKFLRTIGGNYLFLGAFSCLFSPGALLSWSMAATV